MTATAPARPQPGTAVAILARIVSGMVIAQQTTDTFAVFICGRFTVFPNAASVIRTRRC